MATKIRDYIPLLKEAIAEARVAGLVVEADELEWIAFAAFTTSSEMLQEHSLAIRHFLKVTRKRLPRPIREKLQACLTESELLCPGWRGLMARWKRSAMLK